MSSTTFHQENIPNVNKVKLESGVFAGIEDVAAAKVEYQGYKLSKNGNTIATLKKLEGGIIRCMGSRLIQAVEDLSNPKVAEISNDELVFHSAFELTAVNNSFSILPIANTKKANKKNKKNS